MAKIVNGWIEGYAGVTRQQFTNKQRIAWKRQPAILLLHTTEGSNFPSAATYGDGTRAPHVTVDIKARKARQHYPFTEGAWALKAVGDNTNSGGAIQFELIGTSDKHSSQKPYVGDLTEEDLKWLGDLLKFIGDAYGIPFVSTVTWVPFPESYGTKAKQRLLSSAWGKYKGILGHQHAPGGNSHGDPGLFPIKQMLSLQEAKRPVTQLLESEDMFILYNKVPGDSQQNSTALVVGGSKPQATYLFPSETYVGFPTLTVSDKRVLDRLRGIVGGL